MSNSGAATRWSTTTYTIAVTCTLGVVAAVRTITSTDPCSNPNHPFAFCVARRYLIFFAGALAVVALSVAATLDVRSRRHNVDCRRSRLRLLIPVGLAVVGGWLVIV